MRIIADMTKTNSIKNAIKFLNAVQISPRRFAHFADETRTWWKVTPSELAALQFLLEEGEEEAYSLWASNGNGVEMPRGWKP